MVTLSLGRGLLLAAIALATLSLSMPAKADPADRVAGERSLLERQMTGDD